ncbi:MAG: GMC family oxidoreductase [Solirubrobacterales bacterium]
MVVGSGFGGGITACRLAEQGWRVCVLERGRRFAPDDFIERPDQAAELFWHHSLNPSGIFELRLMSDVAVLCAAGVGGGSLIYANVQLRAPEDVFDQGWPQAITRAALDPYYERAESVLEANLTPTEPHLPKVTSFAAAAPDGRTADRLPLAVHFGADRSNPFSGVPQEGCANLGRCNIGCPRNAMNTVALTYIARAEQRGAEVFPLHEVVRLEPPGEPDQSWRIGFRELDGGQPGLVEAPVVILAAGCLGSSRILLKNRRRLSNLSPAMGTRFSGNGDALGAAFDPKAPDVRGARSDFGPVMTSRLDYTRNQHFMLADGGLPDGFTGLLKVARGLSALTGWRRRLLQVKALALRAGFTDQAVAPRHIDLDLSWKRPGKPPITDSLVFLMIGRDPAQGRMRLTRFLRRFDIQWSKEANRELFAGMRQATRDVAAAAQAEGWFAGDGGPLGKFMTVHPLGGAPMADDPGLGVVDANGKVHGYDGLYVSDGAIIPTALGVNPSKTIAALAERNVEELLRERSP